MKLTVVVPAHNESENISEVVSKIETELKFPFELILVNDHSTDETASIVKDLADKYNNISLIENKLEAGFANAIKAGLYSAKGEAIVPVMGDLCDDLKAIPVMLERLLEGYDVVCGSRYIKGGARLGGSRLKGFLSAFTGWSLYYLLGIPTHDIANAFKMYRKKVIDSINIQAKGFEVSMEIPLKAYYAGFKITEVPTVWREREKGKSSFRMFNLAPNYLKFYLWAIKKRVLNAKN
jgi:glycosyltransferase involved in cell wall biosynthesis